MSHKRGEMYWCHDSRGKHRVVVVSADKFNRGSHWHTVLITTQKVHLAGEPNYVLLKAGEYKTITQDCVIQAESLERTPTRYIDWKSGVLDVFSDEKMAEVMRAIAYVLGIRPDDLQPSAAPGGPPPAGAPVLPPPP